jgi:hypothetical protein
MDCEHQRDSAIGRLLKTCAECEIEEIHKDQQPLHYPTLCPDCTDTQPCARARRLMGEQA